MSICSSIIKCAVTYRAALVGDAQLLGFVLEVSKIDSPVVQILVLLQAHNDSHISLRCGSSS